MWVYVSFTNETKLKGLNGFEYYATIFEEAANNVWHILMTTKIGNSGWFCKWKSTKIGYNVPVKVGKDHNKVLHQRMLQFFCKELSQKLLQ